MELINRVDYFSLHNRNLVELLKVELISRVENSTKHSQDPIEYNSIVSDVSKTLLPSTKATVMVAGCVREGKSTALNNIFGLQLLARASARSVTRECVTETTSVYDMTVKIIDTPGLGGYDIDQNTARIEMKKKVDKSKFVLLLVISAFSYSSKTESLMKEITATFGADVWNRCIVLLSRSDHIQESNDSADTYLEYLKDYCMMLQHSLATLGIHKGVKLFSDYRSYDQFTSETLEGIVAIPVARRSTYPTYKLFPDQLWTHEFEWTDLARLEIIKKSQTPETATESCTIL